MLQLVSSLMTLAIVASTLFLLVEALNPGTYYIHNVQFSDRRVITGSSPGAILSQEGFPITASGPQSIDAQVRSNHIFTIDPTMTTMFNEESQQFAVVDASDGGSPGVGGIICNTTFPVSPFIPIGNSDWSFIQGSEGIIISLSGGRNLAWSLQAIGFGTQASYTSHFGDNGLVLTRNVVTQITLQPLNPSDLRQQWTFIAHSLV